MENSGCISKQSAGGRSHNRRNNHWDYPESQTLPNQKTRYKNPKPSMNISLMLLCVNCRRTGKRRLLLSLSVQSFAIKTNTVWNQGFFSCCSMNQSQGPMSSLSWSITHGSFSAPSINSSREIWPRQFTRRSEGHTIRILIWKWI